MNTVKWIWIVLGWLLPLSLLGQSGCGCDQIRPTRGFGTIPDITQEEAQTLIKALLTPFARKLTVSAMPFVCRPYIATADICSSDSQNYIFYSTALISLLRSGARQGATFVMAHELAHHLLGHTNAAFNLKGHEGAKREVGVPAQNAASTHPDSKAQRVFLSRQHLLELEADALALWLIIKQYQVTKSSMDSIFRVLPRIVNRAATPTHPSLALRKQLIDQQWARLEDKNYLKGYLASHDEANREPGVYDPANPLHYDVETAYGFALRTTDSTLTEQEQERRDSLVLKDRITLSLMLGGQYQRPDLSRDGQPVAATDSRGFVGGVQLGIGPWYRRHRLEIDLLVSLNAFTTQLPQGDGSLTAETFKTTSLLVRPRYVYTLHRRDKYDHQLSHSWLLTGGLSLNVPLRLAYENKGVESYKLPTAQSGLWPTVGVGYGLNGWRHFHGQLYLLYQPQTLRFNNSVPGSIRATLHTISLEASLRLW